MFLLGLLFFTFVIVRFHRCSGNLCVSTFEVSLFNSIWHCMRIKLLQRRKYLFGTLIHTLAHITIPFLLDRCLNNLRIGLRIDKITGLASLICINFQPIVLCLPIDIYFIFINSALFL